MGRVFEKPICFHVSRPAMVGALPSSRIIHYFSKLLFYKPFDRSELLDGQANLPSS
jgi:hypothetical protein